MATNHGRLTLKLIMIEGRPYGQPVTEDGTPWKDVAEAKPGAWFIAVLPDGTIISAEPDPMQSLVVSDDVDIDIWEIEHAGPAEEHSRQALGRRGGGAMKTTDEFLRSMIGDLVFQVAMLRSRLPIWRAPAAAGITERRIKGRPIMRRTIVLNEIEPSPLSFRQPMGVNLDLLLVFRDQANVDGRSDRRTPQLALWRARPAASTPMMSRPTTPPTGSAGCRCPATPSPTRTATGSSCTSAWRRPTRPIRRSRPA